MFPAQGVIGISPLEETPPDVRSIILQHQQMSTVLVAQEEQVLALQQDISQLPNTERSNLNNKFNQIQVINF